MNRGRVFRTLFTLGVRECWRDGRPRRGLLPLVLMIAMAGVFGSGVAALVRLAPAAGTPSAWAHDLLGWTFTLAFLMSLLGDLHATVESAVTGAHLPLLRAAPLTAHEQLAFVFVQTLPRTLPPVVGVALPVAAVWAATHPGISWAAVAGAMLLLWSVPLGLGTALALPLLRVAPASRVRESLAVLATLAFVAGWLANAFWMPHLASSFGSTAAMPVLPPAPAASPGTWAAELLLDPDAAGIARALLAVAAALTWAGFSATRLLASLQERAAAPAGRQVRASARPAPTLLAAFLRRDAALAGRDWPVLLDALASLALWTLLPLALLPVVPLERGELARAMLVALSLSLGNDLAARALPLEREALAWSRLSPVGGARWVWARAAGVLLVSSSVVLAASLLLAAVLGLEPREWFDAAWFALSVSAVLLAAGMAVGAALGDLAWTDPRAMLGVGGRSVSAFTLLAIASGAFTLSHVLGERAFGFGERAGIVVVAAGLAAALLTFAARTLARREFAAR